MATLHQFTHCTSAGAAGRLQQVPTTDLGPSAAGLSGARLARPFSAFRLTYFPRGCRDLPEVSWHPPWGQVALLPGPGLLVAARPAELRAACTEPRLAHVAAVAQVKAFAPLHQAPAPPSLSLELGHLYTSQPRLDACRKCGGHLVYLLSPLNHPCVLVLLSRKKKKKFQKPSSETPASHVQGWMCRTGSCIAAFPMTVTDKLTQAG